MNKEEINKVVSNIEIDSHPMINPENIQQTRFDQEVIKSPKKPGPKRKLYNKKKLQKIRTLVLKGAIYDNQIFPCLGISQATWSEWKNKYPEIIETMEQAENERDQQVQLLYNDILYNPDHKAHPKYVQHHFDRKDKRELAKLAKQLEVNHTFNPIEKLAQVEIDKLLEDLE